MTLIKSISGIRGTIGGRAGEALTPIDIVKFTAAYGKIIVKQSGIKKIVVGRDAKTLVEGENIANVINGIKLKLSKTLIKNKNQILIFYKLQ